MLLYNMFGLLVAQPKRKSWKLQKEFQGRYACVKCYINYVIMYVIGVSIKYKYQWYWEILVLVKVDKLPLGKVLWKLLVLFHTCTKTNLIMLTETESHLYQIVVYQIIMIIINITWKVLILYLVSNSIGEKCLSGHL